MQGTKQEFKGKNWPFLKQNLAQWEHFVKYGKWKNPLESKSRGVAQPGSAHRSGRWGRRFKSSLPDQQLQGLEGI